MRSREWRMRRCPSSPFNGHPSSSRRSLVPGTRSRADVSLHVGHASSPFVGRSSFSVASNSSNSGAMGSQQFCLKWNNHQSNMLTVFEQLLSNEAFVDVTLACEGLSLKAHKMVLSACSPFFQALFVENPCKHPIVILKDTRYMDLKAIVEFMYRGEVNVSQDQLSALLKTAETLKVKGLAEVTGEKSQNLVPVGATNGEGTPRAGSPPLAKRKRGRPRRRSASDSNRSDSEDQGSVTRVKGAPDSPEIIEDGSLSCDRLTLPTPAKVAATSSSSSSRAAATTTTAVVPVTKDSTVHEDSMPVDDATGSPDDVDFEVDASNLMEQSMTTENARVFPEVQSSTLVLPEAPTHHTGSSQEASQLATSLPSDISISPQDIKPAPSSLIPYNDPSASSSAVVPTQPPTVAADASSGGSLLFMDTSGVPAIPGPSNYNADKQPSTPSHGLPLPEVLKTEEADQGQIDSSHAKEGGNPEVPSRPSRRRTCSSNVFSLSLKERAHLNGQMRKSYGDQTRKRTCGTSVSMDEELLESETSTNTGRKRHVCNVCRKSFQYQCHLNTHIRIHTGERPFTCNVCKKSFSEKSILKAHIRIHTGEKPFSCNICKKSFSKKCNLKAHIRIHTGERLFTCNVCEKSFSHKRSLDTHIRIHTGARPFSCNVCEKSFTSKSDLNRHIRIHTGERPFRCKVCEKSFSQKCNLDAHIRIHTPARLFPCNVCKKSFSQKNHLDTHICTHTG